MDASAMVVFPNSRRPVKEHDVGMRLCGEIGLQAALDVAVPDDLIQKLRTANFAPHTCGLLGIAKMLANY
jgi:hypothetical protein